jgi:hypothetical protein
MSVCYDNTAFAGCHTDAGGNRVPVVIHYRYDTNGAPAVRITDLAGAVVPAATLLNTTPGACPAAVEQRRVYGGGINIASGTFAASFDPNGNGTSWGWAPTAGLMLQSFTVTALRAGAPGSANSVRVRFGATGSEVFLTQGQTYTWSVAQDAGAFSEAIDTDFRVDVLGNAAASIAWTEQS